MKFRLLSFIGNLLATFLLSSCSSLFPFSFSLLAPLYFLFLTLYCPLFFLPLFPRIFSFFLFDIIDRTEHCRTYADGASRGDGSKQIVREGTQREMWSARNHRGVNMSVCACVRVCLSVCVSVGSTVPVYFIYLYTFMNFIFIFSFQRSIVYNYFFHSQCLSAINQILFVSAIVHVSRFIIYIFNIVLFIHYSTF